MKDNIINFIYYFIFYPLVILYTLIILSKGFSDYNWDLFWSSLYHSDFFINYKSGFIRRGFDGSIIYFIAEWKNYNPLTVQKVLNLSSFFVFAILMLVFIFKNKIVPTFYILSTGCLLLYLEYIQYGIRKDHLIVIYLIALMSLSRVNNSLLKYFLLNLICIIATLTHEVFFIISFIPIIFLFYNKSLKKLYIIIPSIIVFFLTVIFKGIIYNEQVILNSWSQLHLNSINFNEGIFTKTIFIWKAGLTIPQFFGLFIVIMLNMIFLLTSISLKLVIDKKIFILIFLQYMIGILLCVVAVDFSRWIFFVNISIILVLNYLPYRKMLMSSPKYKGFKIFICMILFFIINIQHVGWTYNIYINNLPIKIIYQRLLS